LQVSRKSLRTYALFSGKGSLHWLTCFSGTLPRMNASTRRQFLVQCAGTATGTYLLSQVSWAASSEPHIDFPTNPRDRVAVAAYPFREFIVGWKGWDGKTPSKVPREQQMELKDFAAHVADKFNVHHIELLYP